MIDAVTKIGGYAELMHMYGISAAFRVTISSFMPQVGLTPCPYSRTIVGRGVRSTASSAFTLMWTMHTWKKTENFVPNHFALLLPLTDTTPQTCSIRDEEDAGPHEADVAHVDGKYSAEVDPDIGTDVRVDDATIVDPDVGTDGGVDEPIWTDGGVDDVTVDDPDAGTDGGVGVDNATEVVDAGKATAPQESLPVDDHNDNESVVIDDCDVIPTAVPAEGMQPLPDDTWLSMEMIVNLLHSSPSDSAHKAVPRGHKEYCYCVVDNKGNVDRQCRGQRHVFDDDCGTWNRDCGRMCIITSQDGGMRRVFLREGQYCVERKRNGRRTYEPFDPQPDPSTVVRIT